MLKKVSKIWLDGKMVPWDEANVHVLTHTLHYGVGAFEGIRFYEGTNGKSAVFRLKEHIERLFDSSHILTITIPFTPEQLMQACKETVRANGLKKGYIRPIVFIGDGEMGIYVTGNPIRVAIPAWEWGAYLGEEGIKNGIRAKISSYTRHHVNAMFNKAKASGNYINSFMAKQEAIKGGYEESILLDTEGYVSECSGQNIFIVKGNVVKTTPAGSSILEGITAKSVMTLCEDHGIKVVHEKFARDELYLSDEVFITGTAAEVTPVREIDDRKVGAGKPGPVTRKLQEIFFSVVRGENPKYKGWLDPV